MISVRNTGLGIFFPFCLSLSRHFGESFDKISVAFQTSLIQYTYIQLSVTFSLIFF